MFEINAIYFLWFPTSKRTDSVLVRHSGTLQHACRTAGTRPHMCDVLVRVVGVWSLFKGINELRETIVEVHEIWSWQIELATRTSRK